MRKEVVVATLAAGFLVCSMAVFASAAEEASEESIKLTYMQWGSDDEANATRDTLTLFSEEHEGVEAELVHVPWGQFLEKLNAMVVSGTLPDTAAFFEFMVFQWKNEGRFLDLSDVHAGPRAKMPVVQHIAPDGSLVAAAGAVEIMIIFYNKDIFDEAGIPYPPARVEDAWTWDEFLQVAKQLTVDSSGNNALSPDFDPENIDRYGYNMPLWFMPIMSLLWSNEGYYFNHDYSEVAAGSDATLEAIDRIAGADERAPRHAAVRRVGAAQDRHRTPQPEGGDGDGWPVDAPDHE